MGERFYEPLLGSKIKTLLFEPVDTINEELLKTSIADIAKKEQRAKILEVVVVGNVERQLYTVQIFFESIHFPGQILSVNIILKRIR